MLVAGTGAAVHADGFTAAGLAAHRALAAAGSARVTAALVFAGARHDDDDYAGVLRGVARTIPGAVVTGCSATGVLTSGEEIENAKKVRSEQISHAAHARNSEEMRRDCESFHECHADIDQSDTLQRVRDERDERHICPLQLPVIHRGVLLWSNPGDVVLSSFAGIGSERAGDRDFPGQTFVQRPAPADSVQWLWLFP